MLQYKKNYFANVIILKKKKNTAGWTFLLLFCIPLIGVGIAMGYTSISCLIKWQAMKSWVEVPAIIQNTHLNVKQERSSEGGTSTSYKVTASYSYTYKDNSYIGSQVTMHTGSNSFPFHKKIYEELIQCKNSGKPFHCYVNPQNPSEAILFRTPRWEVIYTYFCITIMFGGVGCVLLLVSLRNRKIKQHEDQLKSLYPDEPWRWKIDWQDGRILSHSKLKAAHITGGVIIWNLVSSLACFIIYEEFKKENYIVLIFLIFPAVGIGLAIWAFRLIMQWFKYGQSTFEMQSVPGVIGGALSGKIHTTVNIKPHDGFHLRLSCINRVTTGSGKHRKTRENVKWQDTCDIAHEIYEYDPSRSVIPVLFSIPFDSQETNKDNTNDQYFWRLEISAQVPGVDYDASFEVPVFKTPKSSEDFVLDESSIAAYQAHFDLETALSEEGIRIETLPSGGKSYYFPTNRNKGFILVFFLLFVFLTFMTVLLFKQLVATLFPLKPEIILFLFKQAGAFFFLVLFDIFCLVILLASAFFQSRADLSDKTLTITNNILFLKKIQKLNLDDIESFKIKNGSTFGSRVYYNLRVNVKGGKNHLIAQNLPSRYMAENLIKEMENVLLA